MFGGEGRDPDIRPTAERREHLTDVPADAARSVDSVGEDADSKWFTRLDEWSPIVRCSVQYEALAQGVRTLPVAVRGEPIGG